MGERSFFFDQSGCRRATRGGQTVAFILALAGCAASRQNDAAPNASPSTSAGQPVAKAAGQGRCAARPAAEMPAQLSQLGCFDGDDPRWLGQDVIPFAVNAPLWTDGAEKERFMSLPEGSQIALDDHGDFVLPAGTLLGKTFSLGGVRVETRILSNDGADGWHGYSYRWNADGTDAQLEPEQGEELHGVGPSAQDWTLPARSACMQCHTPETHVSLGLEVAQLERDFEDPRTGETGNQLDKLIAMGVLDGSHPTLKNRPKLADYHDASQPLESRARAYLHANCGSCHTAPENFCTGDLRWTASDAEMGVCNAEPKVLDPRYGWPEGMHVLTPGDPERSVMIQRLRAPGGSPTAMPPIGRHGIDADGVALITQWIEQMRGCAQ